MRVRVGSIKMKSSLWMQPAAFNRTTTAYTDKETKRMIADLVIGNQLYIKRAECNHTKDYITRAFANVGVVKDVEFNSKTNERGQKYNGAIVTFEKWHAGQATKCLFEQLATSDDVQFHHNPRYYWVIMQYRPHAAPSIPAPAPAAAIANQYVHFGNELDAWMEKSMQMDASAEAKDWMRFLIMQFHATQQKVQRWYGDGMEMQIRETRNEILRKELESQQLLLEHALEHRMDEVRQENEQLRMENEDLRAQLRDAENILAYLVDSADLVPEPEVALSVSSSGNIAVVPCPTLEPLSDTTAPDAAPDAAPDTLASMPALELAPHMQTFLSANYFCTSPCHISRFPSPPALNRERIMEFNVTSHDPTSPFTLPIESILSIVA